MDTSFDIAEVEQRASEYRQQLAGKYFAFPIEPSNPVSEYAVVAFLDGHPKVFPRPLSIEEAAASLHALIEGLEQEFGLELDYDRDVRFITYAAQMDGPSVTMRRLKKSGELKQEPKGYLTRGKDVTEYQEDGEDRILFSGRGLVKYSYLLEVDEKNPKAERFMDGYYRMLAMHRYGKTAAAILWIEHTYERYIEDETPIFELLQKK